MKRIAYALLMLVVGGMHEIHAASDESLVVMVEAHIGESSNTERGAGIIVEESPERTVIVTALHVVENAEGDKASEITVEFSSLRGQLFKATTNGFYADPSIDLAVLFVDRPAGHVRPQMLSDSNKSAISPSRPASLAGASVKIVGAMRRQRWSVGTEQDRVVSGTNRGIQIASSEARAGASGCAVFDTLGRLLGMGTNVDSATGYLEAVPMAMITKKLAGWKLSVGLTVAEAGTTSYEISDRFSKELQITSTYVPSPADSGHFSTTFRLSAKMTPLLRSLSPTQIEISYWSWFPEVVTTAVLLPPEFSTEHSASTRKENAQVWVVIADGRRLGPFPLSLDFETEPIAAIRRFEPRFGLKAVNGTLKIVQVNLATEKSNAAQTAETRRRQVEHERAIAERDATPTEEDFAYIRQSFHKWAAGCRKKRDSQWDCSYPIFMTKDRLRALRSFQIGTSQTSLSVDIPVSEYETFQPAFAREVARLLDEHPEMTEIYVRVQPAKGDALGPKVICRVSIDVKTQKGHCNDW